MQEAEEQDTCRICSAPAEPDQPLFHPCKCSGTIRYIHQDCLTTWLAHSKKKGCDVCKHPYSFTKVYAPDMPSSLPPVLLIRRLLQHAFMAFLFLIRAVAVAIIWLGVLPWVTVWTWRMYFVMGESTAWWISNRPRPSIPNEELSYTTIASPSVEPAAPAPRTLFGQLKSHPKWVSLSADIFTGQIIASLIVLTFVAVFLLREWISQNARPGVFEEEDIHGENRPPAAAEGGPVPEPVPVPEPGPQHPAQQANGQNTNELSAAQRRNLLLSIDLQSVDDLINRIETRDPSIALLQSDIDKITKELKRRSRLRKLQGGANNNTEETAQDVVTYLRDMQRDMILADTERFLIEQSAGGSSRNQPMTEDGQGQEGEAPRMQKTALGEPRELREGRYIGSRDSTRMRTYTRIAKENSGRPKPDPLLLELRRDPYIFGPPYIPPNGAGSASSSSSFFAQPPSSRQNDDENASPFPKVVLERPTTDIPFSLRSFSAPTNNLPTPPVQPTQRSSNDSSATSSSSSFFAQPPSFRRIDDDDSKAALHRPIADIPFSLRNSASTSNNLPSLPTPPVRPTLMPTTTPFTFSMDVPASKSPNLASYRAPEEFVSQATEAPFTSGSIGHFNEFNNVQKGDGVGKGKAREEPNEPSVTARSLFTFNLENKQTSPSSSQGDQKIFVPTTDDGEEHPDANYPARSKGKRRQIEVNDYAIAEESEEEDGDDMEAMQRRYFRERDSEPHGLNLDMEAFQRDFPRAGHSTDGDDTDSDRHDLPADHFMNEMNDHEEDHDAGDGVFDDEDALWEEVDVEEEEEDERDMPLIGVGEVQAPPQPAGGAQEPVGAVPAPDAADEVEGNVEDDMEGALEAIGLRGPVFGVFQNAALMIFVLDTAIGIGVWIPFTVGKTTALLSLDPRRFMQVLHLPIRAMRIITDPVVDFFAYIMVDWVFPWMLRVVEGFFVLAGFIGWNALRAVTGNAFATQVAQTSTRIISASTNLVDNAFNYTLQFTASAPASPSTSNESLISSIPDYLGFTEPYFEALGREVRISSTKASNTWVDLALGNGPSNRVFAISLGYVVAGFILSIYLNILTVGNARTAGLAVRNAVRQQLLVLKVAAFIFIELVTFPLGCGVVLDLCTVWMFPDASLQTRLLFFKQAPLTAMFYHWVAGTMFMYSFAVLLSGCRSVMRPGAMWFIKDPQDQNSHPIRDILDRPTLTQLRKICVSGLMYTFVVACVVASVACLLMAGSKSILPFRWKTREPLSKVPVDLLFLHLVMPYTTHYFRPKRVIRSVGTVVWKYLATRLRLTSYFFGGRHPVEEYTPKNWKDNFRRGDTHVVVEDDVADGTFRRVPATDNLALPRDMRATVRINSEGEPIDEEAKKLMDEQNAEALKAKRNIDEDYTIVYMPPLFKYRIITFIFLLWVFGAVVFGAAVALPILLGRRFFHLFLPYEVHDGYSLIAGFYLIWSCYLIAKAIDRLDKRRQRRSGDGPRANLYVLVLKRGLLWIAKITYMAFWLGVVIPILLATVIDLYMLLPIRFTLDPSMVPRIRVVDEWALGLIYGKIMIHAHRFHPPNRLSRGLVNILQRGFTHPDPVLATKEVIAPLTGGLLGMIILPGAVFRGVQYFFPDIPLDNRFVFMHVYPAVFILAGTVRSTIVLAGMLHSWSQAIRDKEFLVEMRLKNHEPQPSPSPTLDQKESDEVKIEEGAEVLAAGPAPNQEVAVGV